MLVGVDPTNVPERRAYLRDAETDELVEVPFDELDGAEEPPLAQGFGLSR